MLFENPDSRGWEALFDINCVIARTKIPGTVADMIIGASGNRYVILLNINVFLLVRVVFLDLTPMALILVLIYLPVTRPIGMCDVHFGLMLIMNLSIGAVTPPVGSCLFDGFAFAEKQLGRVPTACTTSIQRSKTHGNLQKNHGA